MSSVQTRRAAGSAPTPLPPGPIEERASADRRRLGETLKERVAEVIELAAPRRATPGHEVEPVAEESFERLARTSTLAVARWIAGESIEVAIEAGRDSWEIFGELAVHRAASLDEVTRRYFRWRNAMAEVLRRCAAELEVEPQALTAALSILQMSLEFSFLRMCECFEEERNRTDSELERRDAELAFLATHDALTGLPNRTLILDRTEQMLARSRRENTPAAALFIDLDNFKEINDSLGHNLGDELLKAVAARLRKVTRESDALGRLGGDEFILVSEELSLASGPELVAERILEALAHPFKIGPEETRVAVRASIGIAISEEATAEELLRHADIAMYQAKWNGRNRFAVFETGMQETLRTRLELEMDLREALAEEQFFLVYQPTIDLGTMQPSGAEALLRWRHPERGVLAPDAFLAMLEETGLIVEVGKWVLEKACAQAAAWRASGHDITIAVNVSARQLDTDRITGEIEVALAACGLEPGALTIEVTETTLMRDAEATARRLTEIKRLGVRIAIDDFGTGYSSLGHLQRFPVDALKIDRSFISGMRDNSEGETLISSLVQLGKALRLETFAEGIEEPHELSLLQRESCDSGQGFLFARPLEAADAEHFLRNWDSEGARASVPAA